MDDIFLIAALHCKFIKHALMSKVVTLRGIH